MNFFNKKFKNFFFKRIIYGYKKLKVQNNIKLFSNINDELTVKQLNLYNKKNLFFGENYNIAEKSIRQKLIREVAGFRLIQFILFFHSYNLKLCYPLCNEWIEVLTNNNIKVNKFFSFFLWKIFLAYKIVKSFILFLQILKYNLFSNTFTDEKFYYLFNISVNNIPNYKKKYTNYGIFDLIKSIENNNIDNFKHDVINNNFVKSNLKINYSKFFFHPNNNIFFNIKIINWYIISLFYSFFGFFFSWKYPFFLSECLLSKIVSYNNVKYLPYKSYFNNSSPIYRPYWTYFAELKNCLTVFYFYSTNIIEFGKKEDPVIDYLGWKINTWNHFYFWDDIQEKYIKKFNNQFNSKIVGPINFIPTIKNEKIIINKNSICVFDIRPVKNRLYCYLGKRYEYYVSKIVIKFIKDIFQVAEKLNMHLIIKQKRITKDNQYEHPDYTTFINEIEKNNNVTLMSDIEGEGLKDLINQSKVTISYPYTSTAILSKKYNINSVYYDPTGEILINNILNHNIHTINSKDKLIEYIKKLNKISS